MDLATIITDDTAKITVSGMIDTLDSGQLFTELDRLPKDVRNIEFDLDNITYISSSGLRALLRATKIAAERGGVMKVVKSSEFVREILTTVGFNNVFSVE